MCVTFITVLPLAPDYGANMYDHAGSALDDDVPSYNMCINCIQNVSGTTADYALGQCVYNATNQRNINKGLVAPGGVAGMCYATSQNG